MEYNPMFDLSYIKERREMLGFTHQQMAAKLGFKNASTYFKYEKGAFFFKAVHLPILASILNCHINDFFKLENGR